jgi:hypothetical protein
MVLLGILTPPYYERHLAHSVSSLANKVSISQHPPFVTGCYFVHYYACTTSACTPIYSVSSIVLLEILTPPYYEGRTGVSHKTTFHFLNTSILFCMSFVYIIMHVPPQPVPGLASKVWLWGDIDSIYMNGTSALAYHKQSFSFLDTLHLCELLFVYIIMHVPPQPVPVLASQA